MTGCPEGGVSHNRRPFQRQHYPEEGARQLLGERAIGKGLSCLSDMAQQLEESLGQRALKASSGVL